MTPKSFEFTITMPGDPRLIGAIRQLTAHAAGYAHLSAEDGAAFAGHVEEAAETAVAISRGQHAPIELRFSGDEGVVNVHIACDAPAASKAPSSSRAQAVSVDWSTNGSRHVCHIHHRSPA